MGQPLPPIAVTMGEPAGIGGEVVLKAWRQRQPDSPAFFVVDNPRRLQSLATRLGLKAPLVEIAQPADALPAFAKALPVLPLSGAPDNVENLGHPSAKTAPAVIASIDRAVALVREGDAAAVVTAPIQKQALQDAGFAYPGHTEYLGSLSGIPSPVMMLTVERISPPLRVVPVTIHEPIARVAKLLTPDKIIAVARTTWQALKTEFGLPSPRLGVAALNPHAGEAGHLGDEETRIVAPALTRLAAEGIAATGPLPADTMFHAAARRQFDAIICMYHDQALIPLKTLDFSGGVNLTLGLPFVRTSPDHGTALDIATQGIADPASMVEAIALAARLAARRRTTP